MKTKNCGEQTPSHLKQLLLRVLWRTRARSRHFATHTYWHARSSSIDSELNQTHQGGLIRANGPSDHLKDTSHFSTNIPRGHGAKLVRHRTGRSGTGHITCWFSQSQIQFNRITELINEIIATSPWWRVMDVTLPKPFWCCRTLPPPQILFLKPLKILLILVKMGEVLLETLRFSTLWQPPPLNDLRSYPMEPCCCPPWLTVQVWRLNQLIDQSSPLAPGPEEVSQLAETWLWCWRKTNFKLLHSHKSKR